MTTLGYWDIRGYGQPIRNLLVYLGVEFTDKKYTMIEQAEWFEKDKKELGIPLANLPYLIDEDIKLTESNAIPVYLIKKYKRHELLGANVDGTWSEKEMRVKQILEAVLDFRTRVVNDAFSSYYKFDDVKEKAYEANSTFLKKLVDYLGQQEFLVGTLSYADFVFYETLINYKFYYPQAEVPTDYLSRFENIPELKEYLKSPKCNHNHSF